MTKNDYIKLGFKESPEIAIDSLIYDLGRNRILSASSAGTPNEIIWICQKSFCKGNNDITDIICLHNWDYDGYMTKRRLGKLIKAFTIN